MTALFLDTLDTVYVSKPGSNSNVIAMPSDIVSAILRGFTIATEGSYPHIYTDLGTVSERELVLSARQNSAQKLYLNTLNPASTHVLAGAVKFGRDPLWGDASYRQGIQHCIAGWNAGCTAAGGNMTTNNNQLSVDESGNLKIGTLPVTLTGTLPYDTYVALQIEIIPSTTTINVYVNGSLALTTAAGPNTVTQLGWISSNNVNGTDSAIRVDDTYCIDYAGASWNSRPLDVLSFTRVPLLASVGTPAFSPISAGSNLAAVNKHNLDITSYVRSGAADDVGDLYTLDGSALTDSQTVKAVILQTLSRKTALTPRAIDATISDGTNSANKAFSGLDVTFKGSLTQAIFDKQPDGITDWTVDAAKALQVGYTVRSGV